MEEHNLGFPGDDADVALGKAVLQVRANAGEGLTLLTVEDLGVEITRLVDAIVTWIMMDVDDMWAGELLKVAFGRDDFFTGGSLLVTAVHVFCDTVNCEQV